MGGKTKPNLLAIKETQLDEQVFPEVCPYTPEQVMNAEFFPD
ncbi:MAG: DUF29 family protein [Phormidium sp.]